MNQTNRQTCVHEGFSVPGRREHVAVSSADSKRNMDDVDDVRSLSSSKASHSVNSRDRSVYESITRSSQSAQINLHAIKVSH